MRLSVVTEPLHMTKTPPEEFLLLPIGNVASELQLLSHLCHVIESTFDCRCIVGTSLPVPDDAYDMQRNQYSARAILYQLPPRRDGRVLGIVDLDLFVPELNFVFGLAEPDGGRAVIALPRLREGLYGRREHQALFLDRAAKEAVHELGHTYGLEHCLNRNCVMAFSNSLLDTDRKSQKFCVRCASKLP